MLHTVLRRKAAGERVEDIRKDLIIPTGKGKGENPSLAGIYRALAEHEKTQAYPEAVEAAHADFALLQGELQGEDIPRPRPARIRRPGQALTAQEAELRAKVMRRREAARPRITPTEPGHAYSHTALKGWWTQMLGST